MNRVIDIDLNVYEKSKQIMLVFTTETHTFETIDIPFFDGELERILDLLYVVNTDKYLTIKETDYLLTKNAADLLFATISEFILERDSDEFSTKSTTMFHWS